MGKPKSNLFTTFLESVYFFQRIQFMMKMNEAVLNTIRFNKTSNKPIEISSPFLRRLPCLLIRINLTSTATMS
jgi:hypothetical protein